MSNSSNSSSGGIGFAGLLTIVFIVLKLTDVIAWSWWWVLSPLWIGGGLPLLILAIVMLAIWGGDIADERRRKKALARRAQLPERHPLRTFPTGSRGKR